MPLQFFTLTEVSFLWQLLYMTLFLLVWYFFFFPYLSKEAYQKVYCVLQVCLKNVCWNVTQTWLNKDYVNLICTWYNSIFFNGASLFTAVNGMNLAQ